MDKKELELILSSIPRYDRPKRMLEQYETPPSILAHILWEALLRGDVENKTVLDLGCGALRFSIGSLILGAKTVIGVDIDEEIVSFGLSYSSKEYENLMPRLLVIIGDVRDIELGSIDTVLMNPPFGVYRQNRGLDMLFLAKAFHIGAESVYSLHKYSHGVHNIVKQLTNSFGYKIIHAEILDFPIPMIFETHVRKVYRVKVVFYIFKKNRER